MPSRPVFFCGKMGSAASTDVKNEIQAKSVDEIAAALKELPADQLAR